MQEISEELEERDPERRRLKRGRGTGSPLVGVEVRCLVLVVVVGGGVLGEVGPGGGFSKESEDSNMRGVASSVEKVVKAVSIARFVEQVKLIARL